MTNKQVVKVKEQYITVYGVSLYTKLVGNKALKPTIIMDAGYNDWSKTWDPIIEQLASEAQVFMYDRAGLGKSEKTTRKRTSMEMVFELKELLKEANLQPPYLLVGHSYGGINIRLFASFFPDAVTGLVLIDTPTENYRTVLLPRFPNEFQKAYVKQFGSEQAYVEFQESFEQVKKQPYLGDIPLVILSANQKQHYTPEIQLLWHQLQEELLQLSSKSKLLIAEESGHYIHHDEPELVIGAIRSLIGDENQKSV
ncbi:alpha/beta fold hydrolase [Halalkalibacter akibai]|uniref:Abhydrolase n=1 Tax=Halalkalibacter akibai (strain ATCC 43226 / DSM 21942 / CIP 109018 / JCM 9157 / 1139) TaxID=1236973 RepID=W4QYP7_HALA3|nr:alpha/beta hydrolase [Halalkalibacter akibai]GAE36798.1 abhydrolase [Halalkalibacter akibai JCM 9157]